VPETEQNIFSDCDAETGLFRAFNLGKGRGQSVLNMIAAMKKASGFDYQYEIVGRRWVVGSGVSKRRQSHTYDGHEVMGTVERTLGGTCWYTCRRGDVPDLTADPTMAEKELGFRADLDLEEMCDDLWRFQSMNGEGYEAVQ
jgi:UDP-glucose 4-epimerase